ncbi:transcription initiation factor tfiid subunit 7-like [Stylonychia lemnae]|uniref:Transcription initiation factor tfiid subunit 7-like n=1 Tax=Stylonychia lemnae TaxID=5949 RepID=A0A078ANI5_STYLE|nr:transcription initiation factor tfiid subunit 7-like [Stylonychia lemnae]|eukprot:CDW83486.1 transcription initiation factor tfiid subunit 7-like [Stylonychia lemnae]
MDNKIFLSSLCDLPNIIEGQKTLDFRTFYKSVDVAQILFVHNKVIEDIQTKSPEELVRIAEDYNPVLEDQEFLNSLYRKGETKKMVEEQKGKGEKIHYECLKFRHGLAPVAKNIRNIRHKKEPNEDQEEVHAVEKILKDIIDYGFADNVEEELLVFNDDGDLVKVEKVDNKERRKEALSGNQITLNALYSSTLRSQGNYQDGQSSMYSGQQDQFDDATSYRQDTEYNETGYDYDQQSEIQQQSNFPSIQIPIQTNQQYSNQPIVINTGVTSNHQSSTSGPITLSFSNININQPQQTQIQQQQHQIQQQQDLYQQPTQIDTQMTNNLPINTPLYSNEDYSAMKRDLREIKKLIKSTKQNIEEANAQGKDVGELRQYYRTIIAKKREVKTQKKIAKRQLRQDQNVAMQM